MFSFLSQLIDMTTPTQLLLNHKHVVQSPVHDLESFFWLLLSNVVNIIQQFALGERNFISEDDDCPDLVDPEVDEDLGGRMKNADLNDAGNPEAEVPGTTAETVDSFDAKSDAPVRGKEKGSTGANEDTNMDVDDDKLGEAKGRSNPQDHYVVVEGKDGEVQSQPAANENKKKSAEDLLQQDHKRKPSQDIVKEGDRKRSKSDQVSSDSPEEMAASNFDTSTSNTNDARAGKEPSPEEEDGVRKENAKAKKVKNKNRSRSSSSDLTAWAYEPVAKDLLSLLTPSLNMRIYVSVREMLLQKLDTMIEGNVSMAPFGPLLCALRSIAAEYYGRSLEMQRENSSKTFSSDEVEEAFSRYLGAFQTYMPSEREWIYMKDYLHSLRDAYI